MVCYSVAAAAEVSGGFRVDDRRVLNGIFRVLRSAAAPLLVDLQDGRIALGGRTHDADWIRWQIDDQGADLSQSSQISASDTVENAPVNNL